MGSRGGPGVWLLPRQGRQGTRYCLLQDLVRCWPHGVGCGWGRGAREPVFPAAVSWADTHTHTHSLTHSLTHSRSLYLGGPCLLMGPVGLSAGGDSQPQGQQEMGRRVGSQGERGRRPSEVPGHRRAWHSLVGSGGLSLPHLGSGVCGHSWVRLPSSLLVLTCWVSAEGVFLAPINA